MDKNRQWLSEVAKNLREFREKKPPVASPTIEKHPKRKSLKFGKFERLGKKFGIFSIRSTAVREFLICMNCDFKQARWHYAEGSEGELFLCSGCKNTLLAKSKRSKNDAIYAVVNRNKKI